MAKHGGKRIHKAFAAWVARRRGVEVTPENVPGAFGRPGPDYIRRRKKGQVQDWKRPMSAYEFDKRYPPGTVDEETNKGGYTKDFLSQVCRRRPKLAVFKVQNDSLRRIGCKPLG